MKPDRYERLEPVVWAVVVIALVSLVVGAVRWALGW